MTNAQILGKVFADLGKNCTWRQAQGWLKANYTAHTVTDSEFYKERRRLGGATLPKNKAKSRVAEALKGETMLPGSDFSYQQLQKVVKFAQEVGGMTRLKQVVDCLVDVKL